VLVAVWYSAALAIGRLWARISATGGYFAPRSTQPSIPPGVGKSVPAVAGKAKAGMAHSACG